MRLLRWWWRESHDLAIEAEIDAAFAYRDAVARALTRHERRLHQGIPFAFKTTETAESAIRELRALIDARQREE